MSLLRRVEYRITMAEDYITKAADASSDVEYRTLGESNSIEYILRAISELTAAVRELTFHIR